MMAYLIRYTDPREYGGRWYCEECSLDEDHLKALTSVNGYYQLCDNCLHELYEALRERFAQVIACRCPAENDWTLCWERCRPDCPPDQWGSWGNPPCFGGCKCRETRGSTACCEQVVAY